MKKCAHFLSELRFLFLGQSSVQGLVCTLYYYFVLSTQRGTTIVIDIDFSRRPIDIHSEHGAAPHSGASVNVG